MIIGLVLYARRIASMQDFVWVLSKRPSLLKLFKGRKTKSIQLERATSSGLEKGFNLLCLGSCRFMLFWSLFQSWCCYLKKPSSCNYFSFIHWEVICNHVTEMDSSVCKWPFSLSFKENSTYVGNSTEQGVSMTRVLKLRSASAWASRF